MAATFRTRPWQLASYARPVSMPAFHPGGIRLAMANMQQARHAASKPTRRLPPTFRASIKATRMAKGQQEATTSLTHQMLKDQNTMNDAEAAILAPRTIVPISLSKIDGWRDRLSYLKEVIVQRAMDRTQILSQTWQLKKKFFSFAKLRAKRSGVVQEALRLHAEMSYCLAKGGRAEKARLAEICIPRLHRSLIAAIETRPPGKSYKWELVRQTGRPFWPRIVDHKWTDVDIGIKQSFRQAVVGIKSRQRLTEMGPSGQVREAKEMDVTEYLVLWRSVDKANLTQGDWKIYGTLKETTYKDLVQEKLIVQKMGQTMAKQKVDEVGKSMRRS